MKLLMIVMTIDNDAGGDDADDDCDGVEGLVWEGAPRRIGSSSSSLARADDDDGDDGDDGDEGDDGDNDDGDDDDDGDGDGDDGDNDDGDDDGGAAGEDADRDLLTKGVENDC
ncbi:unnamed protein product [Lampetra planeri]